MPLEECDWEMVGLLPLYDPPRHDTADTIKCVPERFGMPVCDDDVPTFSGASVAVGAGSGWAGPR